MKISLVVGETYRRFVLPNTTVCVSNGKVQFREPGLNWDTVLSTEGQEVTIEGVEA